MKKIVLTWLVAILVVVPAGDAFASHTVTWGPGRNCNDAVTGEQRTADVQVGTTIQFIVCVTLGGSPLPGHRMVVEDVPGAVVKPQQLETDQQGVARFTVTFKRPGRGQVEICDADGCLYGITLVTVAGAPSTPTVSPSPAPSSASPTRTVAPPPDEEDGERSFDDWWFWILIVGGAVMVIVALVLLWGGGDGDGNGYPATPDLIRPPRRKIIEDYVATPYTVEAGGDPEGQEGGGPEKKDGPPPIEPWDVM